MELEYSRQVLEKYPNTKFHGNPSKGAELFHADKQRDMTKLTAAFLNFANDPKNVLLFTASSKWLL